MSARQTLPIAARSRRATARASQDAAGQSRADAVLGAAWLVPGVSLLGYGRSSTDEQARSCAQQIREWALAWQRAGRLAAGVKLPAEHAPASGVFVDDGLSGWKLAPDERPGSRELLAFCEAHPQPRDRRGVITLWSLSRLGRFASGPAEAFYWIYTFERLGWRFYSLEEGDLACDDRDRLMSVLKVALHSERDTTSSEDKSDSVARGKRDVLESGFWQGSFPPFGYDRWAARLPNGRPVSEAEWLEVLPNGKQNGWADPDIHTLLRPNSDAEHVRRIFALAAWGEEGQTVALFEIATRMQATGARPYTDGKGWYPSTVAKVLKNEAYLGVRVRDGVEYAALWEPLVDRATWNRVRARLAENAARGRGTNTRHLLSGLLYCAVCGARYGGDRVHSGRSGRSGGAVHIDYYRTPTIPGRDRCEACRTRVRADAVEPLVLGQVSVLADHPSVARALAEEEAAKAGRASSVHHTVGGLEQKRDEARARISRLIDLVTVGGEAGARVRAQLEELNQRVESLTAQIDRLLSGPAAGAVAAHVDRARGFDAVLDAAGMDERKALLGYFVARVELDVPRGVARIAYRPPPTHPEPASLVGGASPAARRPRARRPRVA